MSQLEGFINALNAIPAERKYEKLAEYLFNGPTGWTVLIEIYTKKIQVNA